MWVIDALLRRDVLSTTKSLPLRLKGTFYFYNINIIKLLLFRLISVLITQVFFGLCNLK